ncbi:unnamed protein product [Spirodela intermedia]|uniref:DUF676 domain-containing protein n=1 Tax=Spirodela intermedia TaxID=51605 RepID=A0A7I8KGP2_SPIIN|nr:unnamed protein product [Spirodela intermedia]
MLPRLKLFAGLNARAASSRRLLHAKQSTRPRRAIFLEPPAMLETVHEVAVYIHRFHNLDLFQQGWYQIRVTMRWEDDSRCSPATPARVVQYEVPGSLSDSIAGVWRIDDADHSFSTQPFRIKYARQDVSLSVMVSFNLVVEKDEILSTPGVILRFDLMYASALENDFEMPVSIDSSPAAVHEFRIPPKALLGLHSYCPVHFDSFHAVLIDLSIHIVLLKAVNHSPPQKAWSQSVHMGSSAIDLVKSLLIAHGILLEELQNISETLGQKIDDLTDSQLDIIRSKMTDADAKSFGMRMSGGKLAGGALNSLERSNGTVDVGNDLMLHSMSNEELLDAFNRVGNQLSFLWNTFLKFHRNNRTKILEHLREVWSDDRKAEWSIWMIHSIMEVPHRYLRSGADESSHQSVLGKVSMPRKLSDDPAQTAITRAELHRKSISQMKINNCAIQDMYIFGDPSRVPIILVERHVMDLRMHASGRASFSGSLEKKATSATGTGDKALMKLFVGGAQRNSRTLRIVVFVHGFQGHHLDLRLVRNQWLLIDPGAECLMSEANEEKTSGDFREMGSRLSEEVNAFIRKKIDKYSRTGGCKGIKLSFVGHSIGNIIIRSALTESAMEPFLGHLHTYMSLSGPHLGYWYSSNSLFNSGLWLLKKLKGAQCIHQLTFTDDPDLQNTFFYKLCKRKTLQNFDNIVLLSSPQDGYVPYHSARIELCQASSWDNSKKALVFLEMLNNCLDQIRTPSSERRTFMRCDINFDSSSQGRNLNTIIGRAAHIEFLETDVFARFIMWSFPDLFR